MTRNHPAARLSRASAQYDHTKNAFRLDGEYHDVHSMALLA